MKPVKKANLKIKKMEVSSKKSASGKVAVSGSEKNNKNVARILFGVVILVCVIESMNLFHTEPTKIKTQQLLKLTGDGLVCGPFTPWGIAPIGQGKMLVADNEHNRLLEFDDQGNFIRSWGKRGDDDKKTEVFHEPSGIVSDGKGTAYVVDTWNSDIKGYDEKGKRNLKIDLTKYQSFFGPRGIGFDGTNLVIADTGSHRIVIMGLDGVLKTTWGHRGSGADEFDGPIAVTADTKGNYFVADTDNGRVKWLDANGHVIEIIKNVKGVRAVALDKNGRLYVASDADGGTVRVYSLSSSGSMFSSRAKLLGNLVDQNGAEDNFHAIRGMSIDENNNLMMTNGNGILLYTLPAIKS